MKKPVDFLGCYWAHCLAFGWHDLTHDARVKLMAAIWTASAGKEPSPKASASANDVAADVEERHPEIPAF